MRLIKNISAGLFLVIVIFLMVAIQASAAESGLRDEVLASYQKAVYAAEEAGIYEEDFFGIIPKIRTAGEMIFREEFENAAKVLEKINADLEILRTQRPTTVRYRMKNAWLALALDLVQKFAVLALFAFFFVRMPYFSKRLMQGRLRGLSGFYLAGIFGAFSILISFFDIARYGESAWSFFDLQLIFAALAGFFAGVAPGLFCALLVGLFRWVLMPETWLISAAILLAGVAGGFFGRSFKDFFRGNSAVWMAGFFAAFFHACALFIPNWNVIPGVYFAGGFAMLVALETLAAWMYCAVTAAVLRDISRKTLEADLLKTELLFLQAQINPHFLFNALNTIYSVCAENAGRARELILRLSEYLRRIVRRRDETVSLKEEIQHLEAYLEIESAHLEGRLKIEKRFGLEESAWQTPVPILVLQPLVENALKHGISKKPEGGRVMISARVSERDVVVEIADDGAGMDVAQAEAVLSGRRSSTGHGAGIGVWNVHERLQKLYGKDYGLIYEGESGKGTKVTVRFPRAGREPA